MDRLIYLYRRFWKNQAGEDEAPTENAAGVTENGLEVSKSGFKKPVIRRKGGVRVYSAENIYLQKIAAISGTRADLDEIGREVSEGRGEARDVFDLYRLSQNVHPLHQFLRRAPLLWQKGIVHWYRTFSRQELKLALLDLEIYDPNFDSREMIRHLEGEVKRFSQAMIEAP